MRQQRIGMSKLSRLQLLLLACSTLAMVLPPSVLAQVPSAIQQWCAVPGHRTASACFGGYTPCMVSWHLMMALGKQQQPCTSSMHRHALTPRWDPFQPM